MKIDPLLQANGENLKVKPENGYNCEECGYKNKRKDMIERHKLRNHNENETNSNSNLNESRSTKYRKLKSAYEDIDDNEEKSTYIEIF